MVHRPRGSRGWRRGRPSSAPSSRLQLPRSLLAFLHGNCSLGPPHAAVDAPSDGSRHQDMVDRPRRESKGAAVRGEDLQPVGLNVNDGTPPSFGRPEAAQRSALELGADVISNEAIGSVAGRASKRRSQRAFGPQRCPYPIRDFRADRVTRRRAFPRMSRTPGWRLRTSPRGGCSAGSRGQPHRRSPACRGRSAAASSERGRFQPVS